MPSVEHAVELIAPLLLMSQDLIISYGESPADKVFQMVVPILIRAAFQFDHSLAKYYDLEDVNDTIARVMPTVYFAGSTKFENPRETLEKTLKKDLFGEELLREKFLLLFRNRELTTIEQLAENNLLFSQFRPKIFCDVTAQDE